MRLQLLGTGSADRWPNPYCACASCVWARDSAALRDRTSVLIDDTLLIDPGPDAGGRGVDLSGVGVVLVTHAHPDHLDPAFLLAWTWARLATGPTQPLLVAGPAEAIAACRGWVAPDSPIEFREVRTGDTFVAGRHTVTALPAAHSTSGGTSHDGTALLFQVEDAGGRVLYATDTAALPHDQLSGRYDVVLLEQTFGMRTDHGTAHLDLPGFGREVARLRADGRIDSHSRVVAVHLSHHNGPDLADHLGLIGAELLADGTVITVGEPAHAGPSSDRASTPRRTLVTGGARSGKSHYAEALARAHPGPVTYVATGPSGEDDPDWQARIETHRRRRPPGWRTVETTDLAAALDEQPRDTLVLVDCLTLWLMAVLDTAGWDDAHAAAAAVDTALAELLTAVADAAADVVLVTNEVGSGIVPEHPSGRLFRDQLGRVNVALAAACTDVVLVSAGLPLTLKKPENEEPTWTTTT